MKEDITETLEQLVNTHGLLHILTGLSIVCEEKAALIKNNGTGTKDESRKWLEDANTLAKILRYTIN